MMQMKICITCDPNKDRDYLRTVSQSTMIQALNGNGGYYVY